MNAKRYDSQTLPVPTWGDLPDHARIALAKNGCDDAWLQKNAPTDEHRLTVLNLFVKLSGMRLWAHVGCPVRSSIGSLDFLGNAPGLRATLSRRHEFAAPDQDIDNWESREYRVAGSLHFKHMKKWGHSESQVQAHIDQAGTRCGGSYGSLCYPVQGLRHIDEWARGKVQDQLGRDRYDAHDYRNVRDVRQILLAQGWDPASLVGVSVVSKAE
jgi:hypothetical protein